jgi:pimeloyl-ACP methyl ester carboxylesterase
MKKIIYNFLKFGLGLYVVLCGVLYLFQEKIIFFPDKIAKDYVFNYEQPFEELMFKASDDVLLNGLLFKADSSKGLIFYLHGNAGSLRTWGDIAKTYTDLNYDIFILDYRGFGKSGGEISNEKQLFEDSQLVYNELLNTYNEENVVIVGYSIGTGMASKLASENKPKHLILQAPYYSLTDMMRHTYSFVPTFLLKYTFETNLYLNECQMPITIFHGNQDQVIYYGSSLKLKADFKTKINLITLDEQGHNGMTDNTQYKVGLKNVIKG